MPVLDGAGAASSRPRNELVVAGRRLDELAEFAIRLRPKLVGERRREPRAPAEFPNARGDRRRTTPVRRRRHGRLKADVFRGLPEAHGHHHPNSHDGHRSVKPSILASTAARRWPVSTGSLTSPAWTLPA